MSREATILFVTNSHVIGGGTRVLMNVMLRLPSALRPFVVAPARGPVTQWAEENTIPWRVVSSPPGGQSAGRAATIRQAAGLIPIILSQSVKILHAEAPLCYRPVGLAGLLTRTHRVCHLGFPPGPGEFEWCFRTGPEAVIACYDGQARDVAADLERVAPRAELLSVPNGIDVDRFIPRHSKDTRWQRWRFGAKHVVVIVGHLSRLKGYPTFLRAAARVAATLDDCAFVSVGGETVEPGFQRALENMAGELGLQDVMHFIGWQDDVVPVLQAADVLALPSLDEGLPMAIIEAMAAGLPVVATPVGGVRDAVNDGITGLIVPCEDDAALAEALLAVLRNPELAHRMGTAGRERAQDSFSLDRCAAQIAEIYTRLLSERRGS